MMPIFNAILLFLTVVSVFVLYLYAKKRTKPEVLYKSVRDDVLADLIGAVRDVEAELNRVTERNVSLAIEASHDLEALFKRAEEVRAELTSINAELDTKKAVFMEAKKAAEDALRELRDAEKIFGEKPAKEQVVILQKMGFSTVQIAKKLDKTIGEIEILLSYNKAT